MPRSPFAVLLLLFSTDALTQAPVDHFGVDGFEFPTPPQAFRFDDLDLRDPHMFLSIPLPPPLPPICFDFTDTPIPTTTFSINGAIAASFNNDDDGDGFLDASNLLLFRPLRQDGSIARVDSVAGQCLAPTPTAGCAQEPGAIAGVAAYVSRQSEACLGPIPGTTGSPAYSPAIALPPAPCFVTAPRTVLVDSGGTTIPLIDAQIAASFNAAPATALPVGLLRGFLRESDADQIVITNPSDPQQSFVLSSLLPGGSGNCSSRNDKDTHLGESGWWFYFNFNASAVVYSDP